MKNFTNSLALFCALVLGVFMSTEASGQCLNTLEFGDIDASTLDNSVTNISTCNFYGDYAPVTNVEAGSNFQIDIPDDGGYITVREGTFDGAVVSQGFAPLSVFDVSGADLFIHFNGDASCSTSSGCIVTTIQCLSCDGCLSLSLFSTEDLSAGDNSVVTQTGCNIVNEYNLVTGISPFQFIEFTATDGAYIVVRSGTFDGPVVGEGFSPVQVNSGTGEDLYSHYFSDASCGVSGLGCIETTVQCTTCPFPDPMDGDCYNENQFGSADLSEGTNESIDLAFCAFSSEYSEVTGVPAGENILFTLTNGNYITVREGTPNGPVVAQGFSPVTVFGASGANLYAHWSPDDACGIGGGCYNATVQCTSCPDCPDGSFIGDACDDGDPNTGGDVVSDDCNCAGFPIPENDVCADATPLAVNLPGQCPGNAVEGTTLGSSNEGEIGGITCEPNNPDVFYSFNSGSFTNFNLGVVGITATDLVIGIYEECTGASIFCSLNPAGPVSLELTPQTNYIVRISTNIGFGSTGSFNICLQGVYDCSILEGNIGDSCDDGDPTTVNDVILEGCFCEGVPVAANDECTNAETISCGDNVSGSTQLSTFDDVGTCGTSNTAPGVWYSLTPDVLSEITVATCTDLPSYDTKISVFTGACGALECVGGNDDACSGLESTVIFEGQPGQEYLILVHGFGSATGDYYLSVSCTEIFDCPDLSANIGDDCDDGDPTTINDVVTPDCECVGVPTPANDLCENAQNLNVQEPGNCAGNGTLGTTQNATGSDLILFDCENGEPDVFYSFNSGDNTQVVINLEAGTSTDLVLSVFNTCSDTEPLLCNIGISQSTTLNVEPNTVYIVRVHTNLGFGVTGTFTICVEGTFDCPALEANIGDACDDGNPDTVNDIVTSECECVGEPVDGALDISFNVLCAETYTLELYEPGTANLVTSVSGSVTGSSFTATGLPSGTYDVFVKLNRHLKKGAANITISSGITSLNAGSFIPGDVNDDNEISIQDFSIFSSAYGTSAGDPGFNSGADLNCDDEIDIIDFSSFSTNFGTDGEEPPIF